MHFSNALAENNLLEVLLHDYSEYRTFEQTNSEF